MAKLKLISVAAFVIAAGIAVSPSAQAHNYRFGGVPFHTYAAPQWGYSEFAAPYPYYGREYRRAERDFRKHVKREAKAYRKLRRAHRRYQAEYGYPYAYDVVPYAPVRGPYRFR